MERIYHNLLQSLGFISVNCLRQDEFFKVIDYSVVIKPVEEEKAEYYGMKLVFGLRIDDDDGTHREIWCYRHDYVYVVIINTYDDLVVGQLVVNDDWREEKEVAKLKLFSNDWVFVGSRPDAIQVVAKLLNEKEDVVGRVLFW